MTITTSNAVILPDAHEHRFKDLICHSGHGLARIQRQDVYYTALCMGTGSRGQAAGRRKELRDDVKWLEYYNNFILKNIGRIKGIF